MAEFEAVFGDSDKARTSANKLRRLQQGTRSAIVYASEFRQLACNVNWGEVALIDQFRCGLRDDVQDLLLTFTDPSSFSETITQAIRCDNCLFERRQEKKVTSNAQLWNNRPTTLPLVPQTILNPEQFRVTATISTLPDSYLVRDIKMATKEDTWATNIKKELQ
jgi:hypothetical protein